MVRTITAIPMDKIPFREQDIVPLENIAPDVIGVRTLIVNVYAIFRSRSEWILLDSGLPHCEARILKWVENNFGSGTRPSCILLTHGHFDHTGSVQELAAEWDVPVYVHPLELPFVTGKSEYPPPDPSVGGGLMALLANLYPRGPIDLGSRIRTLPEDGSIPGFSDWRWIHTPGHTPGHVSFFCEDEAVLIAGDAFATTKQESFLAAATQKPELHGPPAYFTTDWDAARDSVVKLARLRPTTIAAGHGRPLAGDDVPDLLTKLANNFDRVARPDHGRYVNQPAA
jgi:glyoxylase-like metal-dependent hydrolase (beta-lactamase superfamily II)